MMSLQSTRTAPRRRRNPRWPYGWWISPQQEWHPVSKEEGHENWAADAIYPGKEPDPGLKLSYDAVDDGWTRVHVGTLGGRYQPEIAVAAPTRARGKAVAQGPSWRS